MLWSHDFSAERVEDLDLRTLKLLKKMPEEQRNMTLTYMEEIRRQMEQMNYTENTKRMREMLRYVQFKLRDSENNSSEIG